MRMTKVWACAVAVAATAAPAFGQTTGGSGLGSNAGGSGLGGTGSSSLGSSSLGSSSLGSSSIGSSLGSSDPGANSQIAAPPTISALTGSQGSATQASNLFSGYYANPYYQGIQTSLSAAPGGFGKTLFSTTTGTGTTSTGARTGTTGRTGTSSLNSANQTGIVVPLPVQINYASEIRFAAPPVAPVRLQGELRGAVDAGGLSNPAGVQVLADGNNNVVLRGVVRDDDERRLAEGLVRLTPGVRAITNELTYPAGPPR